MCGIAGIVDLRENGRRDIELAQIKAMTDAIAHRGPDAGSYHRETGVAFGHRRLSIIDVASGHQPMTNEDESVWVVFNGEIYNFAETREKLLALGHTFATKSDTEVIVHGWEQWGTDCLEHFRGMFAFALWDRTRRQLFIARDRLGVKPIYYSVLSNQQLVFGSELKSLMTHPLFDKTIDPLAVEDFLSLGYVPDPKSIFSKVRKLESAHFLLIRLGETTEPIPKRYWSVPFSESNTTAPADLDDQLGEILKESIKLRMISEVPIGAFLSGGVDSSLVVAAMSKVSDTPVSTTSIGFANKAYDESGFAQLVADQYKTDHVRYEVAESDFALFDQLTHLYDEPFADASAIPTYLVCKLARRRVTVALSGDGGDETFGGYRRYRLHMGEEAIRSRLPLGIRKAIFKPLGEHYPALLNAPQWMRGKTTFQALGRQSAEAYFHSVSIMPSSYRESLLANRFKRELAGYSSLSLFKSIAEKGPDDALKAIQNIDYQTYLPGDINVKVDRASMAHSLEVREPLMDHKIVEWAAQVPSRHHATPNASKKVLKSIARKWLPSALIDRPKQGFVVPIEPWIVQVMSDLLKENSTNPVFDYVDRQGCKSLLTAHLAGKLNASRPLWAIVLLGKFFQTHTR